MGDLQALDGGFVRIGLQVGRGDLHREAPGRGPRRDRFVLLVEEPDRDVATFLDPLIGDLLEPVVQLEVALELAALQGDVVVLHQARHGDAIEVLAVAVAVLDLLPLHDEAGDLGEAELRAAPVDLEVVPGNRIVLRHGNLRSVFVGAAASALGHLVREAQDDELGGPHGSHADLHDQPALEDVERCHRLAEADRDVEGVLGLDALERARAPLRGEEVLDHPLHLHPRVGVVRLEGELLGRLLDRLLHEDEEPADVDVAPLVVVPGERAGAPDERSLADERADGVDRLARRRVHVHVVLLGVGELDGRLDHRVHRHVGRCLPHAPVVVDARIDAGHRGARPGGPTAWPGSPSWPVRTARCWRGNRAPLRLPAPCRP